MSGIMGTLSNWLARLTVDQVSRTWGFESLSTHRKTLLLCINSISFNMKEEILNLRKNGKTYNEIREILGCSKGTISYHCSNNSLNGSIVKKVEKEKRYCIICGIEITSKRIETTTCSKSCGSYSQMNRQYRNFIRDWKLGLVSGGNEELGKVSGHVRRYLFEKYDNKCSDCQWSRVNKHTNTIPLEVEHIDGDPTNHKEENLTLLCPNCHSLTLGHSSKKGKGRRYFRMKYHKEKNAKVAQ